MLEWGFFFKNCEAKFRASFLRFNFDLAKSTIAFIVPGLVKRINSMLQLLGRKSSLYVLDIVVKKYTQKYCFLYQVCFGIDKYMMIPVTFCLADNIRLFFPRTQLVQRNEDLTSLKTWLQLSIEPKRLSTLKKN